MTDLEKLTAKLDKDFDNKKICGWYLDGLNQYTQLVTVCKNDLSYLHYFDMHGTSIKAPK